jgi:hypothetical protein
MLKNKQVEVISNVGTSSSNLLSQLSSLIDQKIADAQKYTSDLIINLTNETDVLKKGKSIDGSYSLETMKTSSSATPAPLQEPIYGMPPGYFAWQTLPPQPVQPSTARLVRPVRW